MLLQHAQEFHLQQGIHLAHFVQEDSAAAGHFETALAGMHGARERALFVAEQLGFQKLVRDGAAVHDDKGA